MNKALIIVLVSILGLFVASGLIFLAYSSLNNPAHATPTPTSTATAVIVTWTPGPAASATTAPTQTPAPTQGPTQTAQVVTETPRVITATPGKTPTAAVTATKPGATPTAGGAAASVSASDQALGADHSLVVARVTAPSQGWIAIYNDEGGHPGAVLGYAPVSAGQHTNVKVMLTATTGLPGTAWAVLLADAGTVGVFEFPGADMPVKDGSGNFVEVSFKVTQ